uniref:Uncharacterized protein n=1 Tax=Leersia perrieri TaxID=77586 RepID=A0A0D9W9P0_9ORYZ
MDLFAFLSKILWAIADACLDDNKLPGAMISCGVLQAACALSLIFFVTPSGIFGHHGKALHWLYYGSLITVVVVGFVEASLGFWVGGDVLLRRVAGRTTLFGLPLQLDLRGGDLGLCSCEIIALSSV